MNNKISKKLIIFISIIVASIVGYLISISIYTRLTKYPIFFGSCAIAVIVPLMLLILLEKYCDIYEKFTLFPIYISCVSVILIFAVFGPVFIDRSISYHIAFYAAEEGTVNIDDIKDEFSNEIFRKRIDDAQVAGVIKLQDDGTFKPTIKAKIIKGILYPIGEITNSLDTYKLMKSEVDKDN